MASEWDQFPVSGATAVADPFAEFPAEQTTVVASTIPASDQPVPTSVPGPGNIPNTPADTRLSSILGKLLSLPAKGVLGTTNAALATLTGDIFQNPDAYQPTEADIQQPLVSGETAGKVLTAGLTGGRTTQLKETGGLSGALKGIIEGTGNAVASATTPENLALIPTLAGVGGKSAARVIAGVFEGQALAGTPEQWKSFNEAKTLSEKFRIGTEMGLGLAIPAAGFAHTFAKETPKISAETITPEGVTSTSEAQIKAEKQASEAGQGTASSVLTEAAPSVQSAAEPSVLAAPTSPETGVPITPEGNRIVGPALVDPQGNIIEQGKLGETHQDLLNRAIAGDNPELALEAFQNDAQHVFVDDQGNVLDRTQAAPVAVKSGQVPEGTTKIQSQMLKAEAPAESQSATTESASPESTTGIAQRVNEARTEAGRTGEILPGEGVSAEEMVVRGRELLQKGADPEAIISGVSEGKAVTGDEMAVLRARREELSRVSDQAADEARKNPNNPELKQAAEDAFKAETDFAQRIKPAATEWHKVGEAMQGETDVQTGTFTGLRRAFRERTGRDVTANEAVTLEKTADRVQKANAEVDKVKSDFAEVVKNETKTTLPKSAEELRNHFAEKFKAMLPC